MRKTIIVAVLALMSTTAVCAQERTSAEDRAASMTERINKSAKRMAKEFDLKEDAQETFVKIYTDYQKEMFATNQNRLQRVDLPGRDDAEKKLSDEEATAKIKENFERQEQQIAEVCRGVRQSAHAAASAEGAHAAARPGRRSRPDATP